ncbi:MAG: DUF5658 family protein [Haloarculaceae archaeon]
MQRTQTLGPTLPRFPLSKPSYVELVYGIVFVWGFGDAVSTILALALTGTHTLEVNPWMRLLLASHPLVLVAVKFAVVLYVGIVLLELRSFVEDVPGWRAWMLGLLLLGVGAVLSNAWAGLYVALGG